MGSLSQPAACSFGTTNFRQVSASVGIFVPPLPACDLRGPDLQWTGQELRWSNLYDLRLDYLNPWRQGCASRTCEPARCCDDRG